MLQVNVEIGCHHEVEVALNSILLKNDGGLVSADIKPSISLQKKLATLLKKKAVKERNDVVKL